jgi:hypothetical protein
MSRNKGIANQDWEVPLLVDVEIGKTWGVPYDLKDLKRGYKEKFVADGVDEEGKKKYKEVKIDVPASLYEIFGEEEVAVESVAKEPQPTNQEAPKFILQELCEEKALELAVWLSTNENGVVEYKGRNVTALFS